MTKTLRFLLFPLCLLTVLSGFLSCERRASPGGGTESADAHSTYAATESETSVTGDKTGRDDQNEVINMPSCLCDNIDTVNIEYVSTRPTFTIPSSLPEDESGNVIDPHFTVGSSMVLQRRAVNLVRGRTTDAHAAVRFGDETYYGAVNDGRFEVYLPPMEAADGRDLVIMTDTAKKTLENVCVGEVFLLGGQSNMVWSLGWSGSLHDSDVEGATEENIRVLRMNHTESEYERADAEGDVAWTPISPEVAKNFSAVGYLFGKRIHSELGIPVGLVQAAVSGSTIAFWFPRDAYDEYIANGGVAYSSSSSGNLMPCLGYNGMIAPLIGMRFRGMVWYQGETNTSDAAYYCRELTKLIETYREKFLSPLLSVTIVELPKSTADRAEKWALVRAAQKEAARTLENVVLSISIDLGYAADIHPREKTEYARRAAEATLAGFFGFDTSPYPEIVSAERVSETAVSLKLTGGSSFELRNGARGFEVSSDGTTYVPASGVELNVDTLLVSSDSPIRSVRYGVIYYDTETADFSKHLTVFNAEGNPLDQFVISSDEPKQE